MAETVKSMTLVASGAAVLVARWVVLRVLGTPEGRSVTEGKAEP